MTATTGKPYNHTGHGSDGCAGCAAGLPLTLADRERLHGRPFISWERAGGVQTPSCTECGEELPFGLAAQFHVCGQEGA